MRMAEEAAGLEKIRLQYIAYDIFLQGMTKKD